jgi:hypothetical protein
MMVQCKLSSINGILPHEWITRFLFGGAVCVLAGLMSKWFGPEFGGLFLAFPAIFPAGACLVEAHERKHKARAGFDGTQRGRTVAGIDAAGAAMGCVGLAGFALICWLCLRHLNAAAVFALATAGWFVLSIAVWWLRKSRLFRRRGSDAARHAFRPS